MLFLGPHRHIRVKVTVHGDDSTLTSFIRVVSSGCGGQGRKQIATRHISAKIRTPTTHLMAPVASKTIKLMRPRVT